MQLFIHKYTCITCEALLNACQALIDQSIRHFRINYTSVRHYGIRHFGIRHSGNHPERKGREEERGMEKEERRRDKERERGKKGERKRMRWWDKKELRD